MRPRHAVLALALALVAPATMACAGDDAGSDEVPADSSADATDTRPATSTEAPGSTADGSIADGSTSDAGDQRHPDVLAATATETNGRWTVDATLSSPYDSPERYADAWRILDSDGNVLGVRELLHDHAAEQPFTRSLTGVEIPAAVEEITIEGRDQEYGWGGGTVTITLDRAS